MITPDILKERGFVCLKGNNIEFIYGNWDYMYNTNTHELFDINDGVGEPQLITVIENLEHLDTIIYLLGGKESKPE